MANTIFNNQQTLTDAGWFNDVNDFIYEATIPAGSLTPASPNQILYSTGTTTVAWTSTLPAGLSLSNYTTSNLAEGSNLYYTNQRVNTQVSTLIQNDPTINWTYNSGAGTLTAIRQALTGDVSASAGSNTTTLATVNSNVGSFGTVTQVPAITVNAKGLVTAASNVSIQIPESQVTNLTTDLSNKQPLNSNLTALAAYNTNGILTQTAANTFAGRTITGTTNRLAVTNGSGVSGNPTIDIDANYVGQNTITTLGTVTTGTWSATTIGTTKGGTGVTSVTTAPTANAFAGWDSNSNLSANNFLESYSTTATSAGTSTLTVGSSFLQFFTGSTTQTVTMPVTSTLVLGQQWLIVNRSTGNVTIQSSGANAIITLSQNTSALLTCILTSGTTAASWDYAVSNNQGALPIALGGTGQTTQTAAFNALSPTTTKGDIIVNNGTNNIRLASGTDKFELLSLSTQAEGIGWFNRVIEYKSTATASNSSAITFDISDTNYATWELEFSAIVPATSAANLLLRTSTNSGSTYDSSTGNYQYMADSMTTAGTRTAATSASATAVQLATNLGNSANQYVNGFVRIFQPHGAQYCHMTWLMSQTNATSTTGIAYYGGGFRAGTTAITNVQILMSSGNISTGSVTCRAYKV